MYIHTTEASLMPGQIDTKAEDTKMCCIVVTLSDRSRNAAKTTLASSPHCNMADLEEIWTYHELHHKNINLCGIVVTPLLPCRLKLAGSIPQFYSL